MSEAKLVSDAIAAAGLAVHLVAGKAQEMLRMLRIKIPIGYLKKAEMYRHILAIEIACHALNLPFDKPKLTALAPISSKIYQEALINCKQVLKIKSESDVMQKLAVQFGSNLKSAACEVLEQYQKLYINKLDENRQALVTISSAVCQAAAFYIVGIKNKIKLKKSEVAAIAEVDITYFSKVVESMTLIVKAHIKQNDVESLEISNKILKSRKRSLSPEPSLSGAILSSIGGTAASKRYSTTNINGKEYRNYDHMNNSSNPVTPVMSINIVGHERAIRNANLEDVKNPRRESLNFLIKKVNEGKAESNSLIEEKENVRKDTREVYDRWKEGVERKRNPLIRKSTLLDDLTIPC